MCARYMPEGLDSTGAACHIFTVLPQSAGSCIKESQDSISGILAKDFCLFYLPAKLRQNALGVILAAGFQKPADVFIGRIAVNTYAGNGQMSLLALTAGIQDTDVGLDFFPALVLQVDSGVPGVQRQCREYGSDISQVGASAHLGKGQALHLAVALCHMLHGLTAVMDAEGAEGVRQPLIQRQDELRVQIISTEQLEVR